jgi:hypothetical protein
MAEHLGAPEEILKRIKKRMEEAWAASKQAQAALKEGKKIPDEDLKLLKEERDLRLSEYIQSRIDYLPLYMDRKIEPPPVFRAAYSDRMAWLMANMANMAYIRFDSGRDRDESEADFIARRESEKIRLEFCLKSSQYRDKDDDRSSDDEQSDTGLTFELVKLFDTTEYETNTTETQAFLAKSDTFAVLSFRGTEPSRWSDVRTDLKAIHRETKAGKVHTGFGEAYAEVRDEIHQWLQKIEDLPLYITGHSLGAALATVATQDLGDPRKSKFYNQIAACYTFGSPRVGDGNYEGNIKVPFYRMVHSTDVVTLVPFFLGAYVHVGDPRYLSRADKGRILYRGTATWRRMWDAIFEMGDALIHLRNPLAVWVHAHDMVHYISKLKKIALRRNPH